MTRRLAIFCGSKSGDHPIYIEKAKELSETLHKNAIGVVYGGGRVGLMGVLAEKMLELGGEVIGIIPKKIKDMEVAHTGITELHVVDTMHERKAMMAEKSDGFIAMPGGIGTMEEIIEVFTWHQLGYHNKPCGFLNVNGYFNKFFEFLDQMVDEGFFTKDHRDTLIIEEDPNNLIHKMM